jgi:DNA-binding transcriptional ArsR family regulator
MVRTAKTAILPIWRSDIQPVILHRLSLSTDETAADIAASSGLNPIVVARHVHPLVDAGIVIAERRGRSNVLRLNYEHPATSHLVALANFSVGLLSDLSELYELRGVRQVVVFGSWARRHHGQAGPPPRDVDLFVETDPRTDPWPIQEACLAIAGRHGVAIDPTILAVGDSANFVDTYLEGPTITIEPPRSMQ